MTLLYIQLSLKYVVDLFSFMGYVYLNMYQKDISGNLV